MDDIIYCHLSMFTYRPVFYLITNGKTAEIGDTDRKDFEETLSALCEKYNVNDVILFGPEAEEYKIRTHTYTLSKFGVRNLNIEVK